MKQSSSLAKINMFSSSFNADFRFLPLNMMVLIGMGVIGLVVHAAIRPLDLEVLLVMATITLSFAVVMRFTQIWEPTVLCTAIGALFLYLLFKEESWVLIVTLCLAGLIAPSIQMAFQWEKAIILRYGKFKKIHGSGMFFIYPIIDKVANFIDQRTRVTDFNAETTLTRDTVPVNVDAIAFWMVWDAEKAVLEVESFLDAISLSAQTALRDAIGKHELADMLTNRDQLGEEIRQVLDDKTNAWGITVESVEIKDINIPKDLEDAMSRQAQAERERQARIILSTAETEIAEKFAQASEFYHGNQAALHLRAMNMVYEGLKKKGSMIIVPSTAVETMGLGAMGGMTAFDRILKDQVQSQDSDAQDA